MAQNIFLKSDEMGKEIRDKRDAERAKTKQAEQAAKAAQQDAAQKEEDKKQGMI